MNGAGGSKKLLKFRERTFAKIKLFMKIIFASLLITMLIGISSFAVKTTSVVNSNIEDSLEADRMKHMNEVMASIKWDSSLQVFQLPPAYKGSWEELLHSAGAGNKILLSDDIRSISSLNRWFDQRGLGVVYHFERPGSLYVPSCVSRRYDAFIFVDSSHAMKLN